MINEDVMLPEGCETMELSDMRGIEGGSGEFNIDYNILFTTKVGAAGCATAHKIKYGWNNTSTGSLAAEIWFHAAAYYAAGTLKKILKKIGYGDVIGNKSFWKSLKNGIDVKNGRDTAKVCGVSRYVIFEAAYATAWAVDIMNPVPGL